MRRGNKIPATVVTGFLGAGKTTLISRVLAQAGGERIALIINEFGEVGVDGSLLRDSVSSSCARVDMVELVNGCICCTVAEDFLPVMLRLLEQPNPPDRFIVETSGLALPQPLIQAFNWPEVRTHVTVDGVICLIDSVALADGRFCSGEQTFSSGNAAAGNLHQDNPVEEVFSDQLNAADIVLLSKVDMTPPEVLEKIEARLRPRLRSGVRFLRCTTTSVDVASLFGLGVQAEGDLEQRHALHAETEDHDHDDFESFVVEAGIFPEKQVLMSSLLGLLSRHNILRLKGFAALENVPGRLVIQAVGPRVDSYFDRPWHQDERRLSRLVFIGEKGMDREAISMAFSG